MGIIDIIIIVILLFGIYFGYKKGLLKQFTDFLILFISSFVSGRLSDILVAKLYNVVPFFNFFGKSEGLKSINIIFWKLILYLILIVIIILVLRLLINKTNLQSKILDSMVETTFSSKILGMVISIPLMIVFLFDIIILLSSPNFNLVCIYNSKVAYTIMTKNPILGRQNINLYANERYIIKRINEDDNNVENYKIINNDIINNFLKTKLVSKETVNDLENRNKLLGERRIKSKESDESSVENESKNNESSTNDENTSSDTLNDNNSNDDFEEDENEMQEEQVIDSDEEYDSDDGTDSDDGDDYCNQFPDEC